MSQPVQAAPQPSDDNQSGMSQRPAAAVGNVPFIFVLLSAILTLIPGSRMVGIAFLVLLAIPALVVWVRARKLTDGSRGLTTSTLVILFGAFILGAALAPSSAPTAEAVPPAPVEQAAVPPAPQPLVAAPTAPQAVPAPQPLVQAPPPTAAPAPRVAPAPPVKPEPPVAPAPRVKPEPPVAPAPRVAPTPVPETQAGESSSAVYYKNCTAARAAGAAPIQKGEPGYRSALDRDGDGTACDA